MALYLLMCLYYLYITFFPPNLAIYGVIIVLLVTRGGCVISVSEMTYA